jgi:glycosyltransferase involved in cell wall biosynthesis
MDAFALMRRQVPASRLIVVGDGPERDRLAARASRTDLAGSVTLLGYRPDIRALLAGADVYVNSSISEGISLTILEAMAAGLPIVATAVGGTPEVIDGTTGVLVPCRNPERLGSALMALAVDGRLRVALAAAARRRLEAQFTIERMVDQYARAYRQLLD